MLMKTNCFFCSARARRPRARLLACSESESLLQAAEPESRVWPLQLRFCRCSCVASSMLQRLLQPLTALTGAVSGADDS